MPEQPKTILEQALKLTHDAELDAVPKNSVAVEANLEGVEASVDTVRKGWNIRAYVTRLWNGKTKEGVSVSRKF